MPNRRRRLIITTVFATLAVLAIVGPLVGYAVMMSGVYNVAATSQHLQFVYTFLEKGMHQSVRLRARDIVAPQQLDQPTLIASGARLYNAHCVECHGAPGVSPAGIGMGMQPVPGPLVWQTVAFVQQMPNLSPADYKAMTHDKGQP